MLLLLTLKLRLGLLLELLQLSRLLLLHRHLELVWRDAGVRVLLVHDVLVLEMLLVLLELTLVVMLVLVLMVVRGARARARGHDVLRRVRPHRLLAVGLLRDWSAERRPEGRML